MAQQHPISRRQLVQATAAGLLMTQVARSPSTLAAQDVPGKDLIGTIEGPEVLTNPAQFPTTFNEAPQLAALVKQGKLPAVAERIGKDPLVLKPLHEVGKYGGTWRRGFTGPFDRFNGWRVASGTDALLYFDYTATKIVPNMAKAWEMSGDGRQITLHLRNGMRWSDGQPFTADDIMFWYQDVYGNAELTPTKTPLMSINGKEGTIAKVDQYTVVMKFPDPYYLLPELLAGHTDLGGDASQGLYGNGLFAPAHYLKQFHPKYIDKATLDKKVAASGLENWTLLFKRQNDWTINPDLPTVSPWKTRTPINTPTWTLERNPYSIWVDTAGNQLPYIDEIVMTLAENIELINLRATAGEYDFQARSISLPSLPVLLQNQQQRNYKVYLDPGDYGCDCTLCFNLSYQKDPEIAKWISTTDFRRALSLGVDRDQLNETYWLGIGTPGSIAPRESNRYSPGPAYRTMWATYDPDKANKMLDELGLTKKGGDGYRIRLDGKGPLMLEILASTTALMPNVQIAEMVSQQWQKIGVKLFVQGVEGTLADQRYRANEHQMTTWLPDGNENLWIYPGMTFPYWLAQSATGPLYAMWYQSDGKEGADPPEWLKQVYDLFRKGYGVPDEARIDIGKNIWKILVDQCSQIGTVGLSPASMGVRVVKTNMGNIPSRIFNSPAVKNPSICRPATFYFKS